MTTATEALTLLARDAVALFLLLAAIDAALGALRLERARRRVESRRRSAVAALRP